MADIAEAFEQHLRSLSDDEWKALVSRVRKQQPGGSNEDERQRDREIESGRKKFSNYGLQEAYRRGYVDANGNPTGGKR
ncbi:hypothetical protein H7J87_08425 [Mycolicibacterium wolinskyi]|uniref:Uncharacterized protein n=1 Tax=Mycolicibacterium wolinskyi TaxID=59750 RepID=A0A1X2FGZ5_9MYCO|nr:MULTISPECIES: hypothetical protein [Mycolicibacterium]MCV7285352.1 hypothetical protein [Mycolicibacterium wolinskyi]MCV7295145.1 hypothetical protein [Mycolicibacterium goodii]ORX17713.1 hypothetical protein AWC31_14815 [Mycolicibacterium wolinskyi]